MTLRSSLRSSSPRLLFGEDRLNKQTNKATNIKVNHFEIQNPNKISTNRMSIAGLSTAECKMHIVGYKFTDHTQRVPDVGV